jgi:hypothetical protein
VAIKMDAPTTSDLPQDQRLSPEAQPDRQPQGTDLKPWLPDFGPDLPVDRPVDRSVDLPPDRKADVPSDVRSDAPTDRAPDRMPDGLPDLGKDLAVSPDSGCTLGRTLACTCDNGLQGSRICLASLAWSDCACGTDALIRVKNGVIGTWAGTATTPWTPAYKVAFTFDSYSHYSARSINASYVALYYGTDDDSPEKQYSIVDIQANGDANGTIAVFFSPGDTNSDTLFGIALSADLNRLKFQVMHNGAYGPLQYDLQRTQ